MDPELPDEQWDDEDEDDELPCLVDCDGCGKLMEPGLFDGDDPLLSVLPDPSAVYPEHPERNGTRLVMVCSAECLQDLARRLRPPPSDEERWARTIAELICAHPDEHFSPQRVQRETGLSPEQVKAGAEFLRRLFGPEGRPARPGGGQPGP